MGENVGGVSVRMMLPTPMNSLVRFCQHETFGVVTSIIPKHPSRCHHVFAQCPHHSSVTGAILEDRNRALTRVSCCVATNELNLP